MTVSIPTAPLELFGHLGGGMTFLQMIDSAPDTSHRQPSIVITGPALSLSLAGSTAALPAHQVDRDAQSETPPMSPNIKAPRDDPGRSTRQ